MPRTTLKLIYKRQLIPKVYFLNLISANSISNFVAGQFFNLEIAEKTYRSYSGLEITTDPIAYFENQPKFNQQDYPNGTSVSLLLNTKPGGLASKFFEQVELGVEIPTIGPTGRFTLQENSQSKVFVATGTGLAPFIGMLKQTFDINPQISAKVFFGVYTLKDNITLPFLSEFLDKEKYPNFELILCTDTLEEATNYEEETATSIKVFGGKVTKALPHFIPEFGQTDFYLCGNPYMVSAMEEALLGTVSKDRIFLERFGTESKTP